MLDEAKSAYLVEPRMDWMAANYDLAVRLFALYFLQKHGLCLRMLLIYLYKKEKKKDCSSPTLEDWLPVIEENKKRLGLKGASYLERRIYRLFMPAV